MFYITEGTICLKFLIHRLGNMRANQTKNKIIHTILHNHTAHTHIHTIK